MFQLGILMLRVVSLVLNNHSFQETFNKSTIRAYCKRSTNVGAYCNTPLPKLWAGNLSLTLILPFVLDQILSFLEKLSISLTPSFEPINLSELHSFLGFTWERYIKMLCVLCAKDAEHPRYVFPSRAWEQVSKTFCSKLYNQRIHKRAFSKGVFL